MLNTPKSIEFKGTSDLPSESISDVLAVSLGYSVNPEQSFDGYFLKDPFNTAKSVVTVVVEAAGDLKFKVKLMNFDAVTILCNLVILERKVLQYRWR